ncbi:MAG TPA: nitroreductase [Anaerolineales bacterium]|nr:nitroreductase [Anaerolineales bacterium]
MDALEAILTRHSVAKVKPDPVSRELIEKLLNAAVQAPNHYRVRPWRFVVLTGAARESLGKIMAESLKKLNPELPDSALEIEKAKPLRAPVLIAVGVDKPAEPKVLPLENICATAAAVENILVAANAEGLGAMWRTGPAARDPEVKKFLGFETDQELLSFVYIGYPDMEAPAAERPSFEDRTVWME